jgi:hypothetical protein
LVFRVEQRTSELEQLVRTTGQSVEKLEVLSKLLEKKVHKNHYLLMQVTSQFLMVIDIRAGASGPNIRLECGAAGGPGQIVGEK